MIVYRTRGLTPASSNSSNPYNYQKGRYVVGYLITLCKDVFVLPLLPKAPSDWFNNGVEWPIARQERIGGTSREREELRGDLERQKFTHEMWRKSDVQCGGEVT